MTRVFDDTTRWKIAQLCADFVRAKTGEEAAGAPALKRAAVAIALTESDAGDGTAFLLTRRAAGLRSHKGQWALPGGRCDAGETQAQAALRELHEELGLALGESEVLGLLDDYPTRSGYLITPVVVWAGPGVSIVPNPAEGRFRPPHRARRNRARGCLQLHPDSREHPPRDPLPPAWRAHSCAHRGADLPVQRAPGRPSNARRGAGTACFRLALI
jgi:8-oxo-dGTP pyrophosphatase MutT (NUDIX family)